MTDANLTRADVRGVDLREAKLDGAKLTHSYYNHRTRWPAGIDPHRHGAVGLLPGADLRGRNLYGAKLTGVDLTDAKLTGARYDRYTRWSDGIDPRIYGAELMTE